MKQQLAAYQKVLEPRQIIINSNFILQIINAILRKSTFINVDLICNYRHFKILVRRINL
jgi:hypothetical protein